MKFVASSIVWYSFKVYNNFAALIIDLHVPTQFILPTKQPQNNNTNTPQDMDDLQKFDEFWQT